MADRALPAFADGAWWVDLTPLADKELVPQVAATALGMHAVPRSNATEALSEFISQKHLLLILDNCEHLIDAAAILVRELLHACPNLHILATSREVLGFQGEKTYRCPPLFLPDSQSQPTFSALAVSEAVRLFTERAQAVAANFRLTEDNAPLVAHVCQRLDGIPLAIELAAARVRLLSMEQIAARLDNVFHLLTGGGQAALPRHQTLKALVDWSYDLLSGQERRLLGRLSVFAGSWTLEAAEAVCAGPADGEAIPGEAILDLLAQLVDKSLVVVQDGSGAQRTERRYRMLEMIRQYAHQRLLESGRVSRPARGAPGLLPGLEPAGRTAPAHEKPAGRGESGWKRRWATCARRWSGRSPVRLRKGCAWQPHCSGSGTALRTASKGWSG